MLNISVNTQIQVKTVDSERNIIRKYVHIKTTEKTTRKLQRSHVSVCTSYTLHISYRKFESTL